MERSLSRLPLTRDYLYGGDRRRKTVTRSPAGLSRPARFPAPA